MQSCEQTLFFKEPSGWRHVCVFPEHLQLAVSSHENATPVKLIHNAAGHLNGPARTIGAAVIGYLGKASLCSTNTHQLVQ